MNISYIPDDVFFVISHFCLTHTYSLIFLSLTNRNMYKRVHHYTTTWGITPHFSMIQITDERHLGLIKWIKENKLNWKPYICIRRALVHEYTEILDWISQQGYYYKINDTLSRYPSFLLDSYLLTKWAYDNDHINKKQALELVKQHTSDGNLNAFEWGICKNILVRPDDMLYLLGYDHVFNTAVARALINLGLVTLKEIKRYRMEIDISIRMPAWFSMRFSYFRENHSNISTMTYRKSAIQRCRLPAIPAEKKSNDDQLELLIYKLHKTSNIKSIPKYVNPKKKCTYHKKSHNMFKALSKQSNKRPKISKCHYRGY
jgi:hypothetical protein